MERIDYRARRAQLAERLGTDAVYVVGSLPERIRNGDAHYPFRQQSDLLYLTGFLEPQTVLVFRPGAEPECCLFVRPRDPEMETWDGRRAGVEGAVSQVGANVAYPISELTARLPELLANRTTLHYALGLSVELDQLVITALNSLRRTEKRGKRPPDVVADPRTSLHELRLHKSPAEITRLRRAADITCEAHREGMRLGRPGVTEREVEALLSYTFRRRGGTGPGYTSIVGAGVNATILHYVENASTIAKGDLVLVDAGCEVDGYTADVTRTFPANGVFEGAARAVYEIVLDVQQRAINMVTLGSSIDAIHKATIGWLTQGMIDLGLLAGTVDARIEDRSYLRYYMHGTSHWLGLDVHDVGAYLPGGKPRPLAPGMVLTVEPGLYIRADDETAPAALRGLGVRIEDDVLVTPDGPDVLTDACPKRIDDVEAACR